MSRRPILAPILATALSFWIAAAACVMGCMQPMLSPELASAAPQKDSPVAHDFSRHQTHASPTLDMECCRHEHGPSAPATDNKPHHQAVSCCPPDARVTPAQKFAPRSTTAFKAAVVSSTGFALPSSRFSRSSLIDDALSHPGRDTLLKTSVLRI